MLSGMPTDETQPQPTIDELVTQLAEANAKIADRDTQLATANAERDTARANEKRLARALDAERLGRVNDNATNQASLAAMAEQRDIVQTELAEETRRHAVTRLECSAARAEAIRFANAYEAERSSVAKLAVGGALGALFVAMAKK